MSVEANKAVARRFFEEFNRGDLDAIEREVLDPDVVVHWSGGPQPLDLQGFKGVGAMFRTAFPDMVVTVEDEIAEGDKVALRTVARGTHLGDLQGLPPTGKQISISAIAIARFENGRVVERWELLDQMGLMQQLGVIPAPAG